MLSQKKAPPAIEYNTTTPKPKADEAPLPVIKKKPPLPVLELWKPGEKEAAERKKEEPMPAQKEELTPEGMTEKESKLLLRGAVNTFIGIKVACVAEAAIAVFGGVPLLWLVRVGGVLLTGFGLLLVGAAIVSVTMRNAKGNFERKKKE
jgi:hypothetical protein